MHGPDAPSFQALRRLMEDEWTPQMMKLLAIEEPSLPVIWDADFLYRPRDAAGADTRVRGEINASSCFAIPDQAPAAIARTVSNRLASVRRQMLRRKWAAFNRNTVGRAAGSRSPARRCRCRSSRSR